LSIDSSTAGVDVPPTQENLERVWKIAMIGGRALLALLFILAGAVKILGPAPFLHHMAEFGVPALLLPAVIALELIAGLALLIGWRVREAAGALAIFCVLTAAIFHNQLWISAERTLFFKDLALAGGLLAMMASAAVRPTPRNLRP
jgi:putative oxidoreductase